MGRRSPPEGFYRCDRGKTDISYVAGLPRTGILSSAGSTGHRRLVGPQVAQAATADLDPTFGDWHKVNNPC
jgi:hypothetical protein